MVVYKCKDEDCDRVFQQEPAYINHMMKHLNEGGEYLEDLTTKRKRRPKTPKPATAPVEKKKREGKRIESARAEWEKRQKSRRETEAATALAAPSGRKNRGKKRRKVWQTIASGRVGDGNGQGEIIDLRSPSRSPSIECMTPQAGARRNFTLTPDTTVPSTSRSPSPGDGISDIAISSLHHLTAPFASGSNRNDIQSTMSIPTKTLGFASRQGSEEAVVANHHSTSTYPTPHASRETSEEAIVIHHHDSVSSSVTTHVARDVSEEAIIKHHHTSPIPQPTRGTSEEAVIIHHHISPSSHTTRNASEEAVTAFYHMSVSISPAPAVSRDTSEEAIIAHHHSSPTPARSQIIQNTPDASPISDRAITEYHHHASASQASHTFKLKEPQMDPMTPTKSVKSTMMEINENKTSKSDSWSLKTYANSLLQPFAYPVSTPLPSPPLTPVFKRSAAGDPFFEAAPQCKENVSMNADIEYTAQDSTVYEPFTLSMPPRDVSTRVQALDEPITPSRLGPSWKIETAPQSVIDEEEIDELESESGEDGDDLEIPRLSQLRLDSSLSLRRPLFQETTGTRQEQDIEMEGSSDSNAWALEYGIDPKQWDDIPIQSPALINQGDLDTNDPSESDAGSDNAGEGSSGEEDDGDDKAEEDEEDAVEGECGYRVFAGWTDIESMNSAQKAEQCQATTPGSSIKPFGSLTPRRPTAFEATTGGRYGRHCSDDPPSFASPGPSTGRVSAELDSPISPSSQAGGGLVTAGLSPSYLFDSKFHYESINSTPDRQRGSAAGGNMPKRDQVILALLQAGHTSLAEDVLLGYTADTHGKQE